MTPDVRLRARRAQPLVPSRHPQPQLLWRRTREPDGANVLSELSSEEADQRRGLLSIGTAPFQPAEKPAESNQ